MVKTKANEGVVMTLVVEKVGQWGVLSNSVWYSISQYGNVDLEDFKEGESYQVAVTFSKSNKPYITSIIGSSSVVETKPALKKAAEISKALDTEMMGRASTIAPSLPVSVEAKKKTDFPTAEERENRDFSQLVGGALHDVATIFSALKTTGRAGTDDVLIRESVDLVVQARGLLAERFKK